MGKSEWFNEWFNSPYYHILYKHRGQEDAKLFLGHLIQKLDFKAGEKILDVCCGKGRHSILLNQFGFDVEGIDLSAANIEIAKHFENDSLKFARHDMRQVYKRESFDHALNLFTSFGYFEEAQDNQTAITAIAASLKQGGIFVLDFLNPYTVIHQLIKEEEKKIGGIHFYLNREYDGKHIIKDIQFEDKGQRFHFQEKVMAIRRIMFLEYFRNANLLLLDTFGDYQLQPYEAQTSERMIFIVKKI